MVHSGRCLLVFLYSDGGMFCLLFLHTPLPLPQLPHMEGRTRLHCLLSGYIISTLACWKGVGMGTGWQQYNYRRYQNSRCEWLFLFFNFFAS